MGTEFRLAGRKEWGGKMQDDITDGVKMLVDKGIADPDHMCIVGASYGGYAALMGAIKTPELFRCAASLNGVTDLIDLINDMRFYINAETRRKFSTIPTGAVLLFTMSGKFVSRIAGSWRKGPPRSV